MRVHKTGHIIADTVADAFIQGRYNFDADLVYGILRHNIFAESKSWFEVDRGFWGANHFDGTYRISYKGTQAKWHDDIPQRDIDFELEDWKPEDKYILICPPTQVVMEFFNVDNDWLIKAKDFCIHRVAKPGNKYTGWEVKEKDGKDVNWDNVGAVITFNSSIGWQALQRGIPVYSDPHHSIIGSYYAKKMKNPIDFLSDKYRAVDREPLFRAMAAHQFKLSEIKEGKAWNLIRHYLKKK